ncbi:MAG: acetate--CoA ligase [Acidimicrobiales bacterium]|nr:acetate--CoA ligase [Acidimicrobiales bacterium]
MRRPPAPHGRTMIDAVGGFSWDEARRWLAGLPDGGGVNLAHEAVDSHVADGHGERIALRLLGRHGERHEVSYAALAERSNRFANVLDGLGVAPGERVFVLSPRRLLVHVAVLGTLKARAVACTLFSAFGPEPILQRLQLGGARVIVTTGELYRRKLAPVREQLDRFEQPPVVLVEGDDIPEGTVGLDALLAAASPRFRIAPTDGQDPALLHFTSGTTGTPKGAVHVHDAVVTHLATGRLVLGLRDGDVFWCTADPGWVTGTSYGIVAPLACGVTSIVDEADFDAVRWYRLLAEERVTVWYTAPTAIRLLMRAGPDAVAGADLSAVRFAASVGEPLGADAVRWGREHLGIEFHDNWWQTETGGIMIANRAGIEVRDGSMGQPIPGIEIRVVATDDDGTVQHDPDGALIDIEPVAHGADHGRDDATGAGMLVLRAPWPSMFRTYLDQPERYRRCFDGDWYLSGDLVRRDTDGYVWFVSRSDDVIKTAGHLIGPFEVESVLNDHPAVVESGVYGVPDPMAGALVHAAVVLRPGFGTEAEVLRSITAHARRRLGAAVAPRLFVVVAELPKTRSGKILRRLLRARELGLPEGDLSSLEPSHA